jgi:hypothetical protein
MAPHADQIIKEFNAFVKQQSPETRITTILFNNKVKELYRFKRAHTVKPLNAITYRPSGCTSLMDAIGYTLSIASDFGKAEVILFTDSEDTTSTMYTPSQIRKLIEERKKDGWQFTLIGMDCVVIQHEPNCNFEIDRMPSVFDCFTDSVYSLMYS